MTLTSPMTLPRLAAVAALAAALGANPAAAAAGHAHEHGVARLDVAVEGPRLSVSLESPLDNLLGFEHAPATPGQRRQVAALVRQLQAAGILFRIDPAAGCTLGEVRLDAPVLGLQIPATTGAAAADDGHGDLDAEFEFNCAQPDRVTRLDLGLWDAFERLQRLDVQFVTPQGQGKQTLRRPALRVQLR